MLGVFLCAADVKADSTLEIDLSSGEVFFAGRYKSAAHHAPSSTVLDSHEMARWRKRYPRGFTATQCHNRFSALAACS
jgi:hypothetical protein